MGELTFLNEFEAVGEVTLVAHEKETARRACLVGGLFRCGNFGTESNALTYNAPRFGGDIQR